MPGRAVGARWEGVSEPQLASVPAAQLAAQSPVLSSAEKAGEGGGSCTGDKEGDEEGLEGWEWSEESVRPGDLVLGRFGTPGRGRCPHLESPAIRFLLVEALCF